MKHILEKIAYELAALIPDPDNPKVGDWPCTNPADRECLDKAYDLVCEELKTGLYRET